jgi:cell division protein FtsB
VKQGQRGTGFGPAAVAAGIIAVMSYLVFAAVQGEYGLIRHMEVRQDERDLAAQLELLRSERLVLANRTHRLSAGALDLDLLEERAQRRIRYIHSLGIEIAR